jgi:hypothetical protein
LWSRPGRDRAPNHEANHFALLWRGIDNSQEPRNVVIADAQEHLQLFNLVTQLFGFAHASPIPSGIGAATSSILVMVLTGTPSGPLISCVTYRRTSSAPCEQQAISGYPPEASSAPRIQHPSAPRRFGIRHGIAAAIA